MAEHITKDSGYASIVKEMHKDIQRTRREREIEAAFGEAMPTILTRLHRECDGNRSEMCRRINEVLVDAAEEEDEEPSELARGTLYNYLDKYEVA